MESTVLVKTFAILEVLSAAQAPMPLAAIASACGLAKPTAHRVLNDLNHLGYVERVDTGIYRLSEKFFRLAAGGGREQLVGLAGPILERLHERTGETVNLGVLRRDRIVYLKIIESRHPLRRVAEPGSVDPFHSTALGRAIVAHLPESDWPGLLRRARLEQRTPHTVTDHETLCRTLLKARRDGYAIEIDENDIGVMCVGAPVFEGDQVAAAISLSAPSARVTAERRRELIAAVRAAAEELTQQLQPREAVCA